MKEMARYLRIFAILACVGLAAASSTAYCAEDEFILRSTTLDFTLRSVGGGEDSAKFQEYRDVPSGLDGSLFTQYRRGADHYELNWNNIGLGDQYIGIEGGRQGRFTGKLFYDKIPHRFANDALSLFSGVGTGYQTVPDSVQTYLQGAANSADTAVRLNSALASDGTLSDIWLQRKTFGTNLNYVVNEPLNLKLNYRNERREGTRPLFGTFGFGSTVEAFEPIDYDTKEWNFAAEFARKNQYLTASYTSSTFDNRIGEMRWDNPFRVTDSSSAPVTGLLDLYPDNRYHNFALSGVLSQIAKKGTLSGTVSWGKMKQDDALVPYTTNTALAQAFLPANQPMVDGSPVTKVDAEVKTTLYNFQYTHRLSEKSGIKARYRMYDYDNRTPVVDFGGSVRADSAWSGGVRENEVISHKQKTWNLDWDYEVGPQTTVSLGYVNDNMRRHHREVEDQTDDRYLVSVDHRTLNWLTVHGSYEHGRRRYDSYDYTVPFPGNSAPPQIPWLRKYDEANRDQDLFRLMATAIPAENFALTATLGTGSSRYRDSSFGLLKSRQADYGLDADYALANGGNVFLFWSQENYTNDQAARQWNPNGAGDPYVTDPTPDSANNWSVNSKDKVKTLGGGFTLPVVPKKLGLEVKSSYTRGDGLLKFSGPLADSVADPIADYNNVDDTKLYVVDAGLNYDATRDVSFKVGWAYEQFKCDDFSGNAPNVPTAANGNYQGALLAGTLPAPYNAHWLYCRVRFRF